MTETTTKERAFLNALRLVVLRTRDANMGLATRDKNTELRSAEVLLRAAQADLVDEWLEQDSVEQVAAIVESEPSNVVPFPDSTPSEDDPESLTEAESGDPEVTFDA